MSVANLTEIQPIRLGLYVLHSFKLLSQHHTEAILRCFDLRSVSQFFTPRRILGFPAEKRRKATSSWREKVCPLYNESSRPGSPKPRQPKDKRGHKAWLQSISKDTLNKSLSSSAFTRRSCAGRNLKRCGPRFLLSQERRVGGQQHKYGLIQRFPNPFQPRALVVSLNCYQWSVG